MTDRDHWERVYASRAATEVSWYAPHLGDSLRMIREVAAPQARIIDVGGGASTLVDNLLAAGCSRLTVLDVAQVALDHARTRLGQAADGVTWIQGDITSVELPEAAFDVWHDRAVFHFLTTPAGRHAYVGTLLRSLAPEGHVVIGTFALSGPERCSGLDVVRYDAAALQRELGAELRLESTERPVHLTPAGKRQDFLLCRFVRTRA